MNPRHKKQGCHLFTVLSFRGRSMAFHNLDQHLHRSSHPSTMSCRTEVEEQTPDRSEQQWLKTLPT